MNNNKDDKIIEFVNYYNLEFSLKFWENQKSLEMLVRFFK
jgi:hypothetical protein